MKRNYSRPETLAVCVEADGRILESSFGNIGGETDRFDSPMRPRFLKRYEDEEEEEW